jgi:hypothetical protein
VGAKQVLTSIAQPVPELPVTDVARAQRHYRDALGFEIGWALSSIVGLVGTVQELTAPAYHNQNEFGIEPSITSFEAFRLTYDRARRFSAADPSESKLDTVPEVELKRRYDVYRADRIAATEVAARQALVTKGLSLLLAAGLFAFHWHWLRRRVAAPAT